MVTELLQVKCCKKAPIPAPAPVGDGGALVPAPPVPAPGVGGAAGGALALVVFGGAPPPVGPPGGVLVPAAPRAWDTWQVCRDGVFYGVIKCGGDGIMSAHCRWVAPGEVDGCHGVCRLNRTCRAGRNPSQGRPVGFLLAWLFRAHEFRTREAHFAIRNGEVSCHLGLRAPARAWAVAQSPYFDDLFALERLLAPGEPAEPLLHT